MLLIGLFHSTHFQAEQGGTGYQQEAKNMPHIAGSDEDRCLAEWTCDRIIEFDDNQHGYRDTFHLLKASILVEHYQRVERDHETAIHILSISR